MAERAVRGPGPARVVGLYALASMERDGPLYGYALAERIAEATDGAWRPGPGAVYPALNALVARGAARVTRDGRRQVYSITRGGRATLRRIRAYFAGGDPEAPDLTRLWAAIHGSDDPGAHLLRHLHRHVDSLVTLVERAPATDRSRSLRAAAIRELDDGVRRLRAVARRPSRRSHAG
ncbi:MAG TPA: PadR family transcriptional regulator [Thermoplasmata archaeon]|nr:PadR family transcriptional regulator [Thermoplasmata archaeon]